MSTSEQPHPQHRPGSESMHDLVIRDLGSPEFLARCNVRAEFVEKAKTSMLLRRQAGLDRYGTVLQAHNGRNVLQDLREEVEDAVAYARQMLAEIPDDHLAESAAAFDVYRTLLNVLLDVHVLSSVAPS